VEVKINAASLIRKERTKVFGSSIFFSSATDPYQYLELKYRISRQCLTELLKYKPAKITMHTRSHLILQDVDLLKQFGDSLRVGVSITTDSESVQREFEPGAPSIARRLELLRGMREAGIRVHASLSPLLPCDPERLVSVLKPFVETIWIDSMRHPEINNRPDLIEKHADFFEPGRYRKLQEWLYSELAKQPTSAARRYSEQNALKINSNDMNEPTESREPRQLSLLLTNV